MTTTEFSYEFDILYNNIASDRMPGVDEYEKSVFLTKAQEEMIKAYFDLRLNKPFKGFDDGPKRQMDFAPLIRVETYTPQSPAVFDTHGNSRKISLPENIMAIINESVTVTRSENDVVLTVLPVRFDEYDRLMAKPYKRPLSYQAWRLINASGSSRNCDLIVGPEDTIVSYRIRYVRRPHPIVLAQLEAGVTIEGYSTPQECELDPILHQEILQRAVELAKAAYTGDLTSQLVLGQTSHTEMGMTAQGGQ